MNLLDDGALEVLRGRLIMLWAPMVPHDEIANRLGLSPAQLRGQYCRLLDPGLSKSEAALALRVLQWRTRCGDADAALLYLFMRFFDTPGISALLALPDTTH